MKCSKCGKEISEQAKFCKYCGTPVQPEKQVSSADVSLGVSKKNSKKWLIIASIVIGILVLTGAIAFTIKMVGEKDKTAQKVEKPKQEDPVKPEEPAEEIKAETPEQAFENYLVFLVDAVNSGDYTGAEKVMVKDSPLYQEQSKLVTKLHSEGTEEKLTNWSIKSQEEIDATHVRLVSDEEYEVTYSDDTVKMVPQSFAYICELTEQGWLLTTLEAVGGQNASNKDTYIKAYQEYINANQSYLNEFREYNDGSITQASYAIIDIQNDGISEGIFQYDESTDTYQEIHGGGYLCGANAGNEYSDITWDGVEYPTLEAYNAKISEVFNKDMAENIEYKDYTFDVDLLQKISYFGE